MSTHIFGWPEASRCFSAVLNQRCLNNNPALFSNVCFQRRLTVSQLATKQEPNFRWKSYSFLSSACQQAVDLRMNTVHWTRAFQRHPPKRLDLNAVPISGYVFQLPHKLRHLIESDRWAKAWFCCSWSLFRDYPTDSIWKDCREDTNLGLHQNHKRKPVAERS